MNSQYLKFVAYLAAVFMIRGQLSKRFKNELIAIAYVLWTGYFASLAYHQTTPRPIKDPIGTNLRAKHIMKAVACSIVLLTALHSKANDSFIGEDLDQESEALLFAASLIFATSSIIDPKQYVVALGLCGSLLLVAKNTVSTFGSRASNSKFSVILAMVCFAASASMVTVESDIDAKQPMK